MHKALSACALAAAGFAAGAATSLTLVATAQDAPQTVLTLPELRRISEAIFVIRQNAVQEQPDARMADGCIAGMARSADPDSDYYDAQAYREFVIGSGGQGGLGMELRIRGQYPVVVAPLDDTPAARAGLRPGDVLMKIDEVQLGGMGLTEVTRRLRGAVRTQVKLTLRRDDSDTPVDLMLTREIIRVRSVQARRLEGGLAYVRLGQFNEATGRDLADALNRMVQEAPVAGLVLDLRRNPGGLLQTAVGVAAVFLPPDVRVLTMRGRASNVQSEYTTNPKDYLYRRGNDDFARVSADMRKVPLAVLVDRGSAAGSEIVAGAFKDHKRAVVIGETTYGRGSIQTIFPLAGNAGLKLTTAEWATPGGTVISRAGIEPDIRVAPGKPEDDQALARAVAHLQGR